MPIAKLQTRLAKRFWTKPFRGDPDARARIDALLQSHNIAGSFLDIPAVEQMGHGAANGTTNTMVGKSAGEADDSDDEQFDLSFLQPSTKGGSIGRLGHYEILNVLGQGGFGVVFKAFDEKLHPGPPRGGVLPFAKTSCGSKLSAVSQTCQRRVISR